MTSITFKSLKDNKTINVNLSKTFTMNELHRNITNNFGNTDQYRLVVKDKQLCLDNASIFERQKQELLQGNIEILLLQRATGGGAFVEVSLLKERVLQQLPNELAKISRVSAVCSCCLCPGLCTVICAKTDSAHTQNGSKLTSICDDCFGSYLKNTNFELRCLAQYRTTAASSTPCETCKDYKTIFKTPVFIELWTTLHEVRDMVKCIDCQICYCGALLFNETLFSQQTCTNCTRVMCFFCNRTWNSSTMTNSQYTCKDPDCTYEQQLEYELVPLQANNQLRVPDRRVCPSCFQPGGYGEACKYHGCPHCKHQFCFMCLQPEQVCNKTSNYHSPCSGGVGIKKQDFTIFPKMN
ncbi:unnamed protein product [Rotaria sp. Silwood2]|nr:unnamed protein product [Rotaria sp. Silwood2]CAF3153434.1 unnamed protein product [Rotaria sp. Silwood2]CAF3453857.1 unnamed protein product [Rotaria sp. Silwood2]CAF4490519.1 unnamed protein product [Rotaria sp. Silwood2]CAF4493987.1 unnamed protein product [Rotaria sp. Silwood2]